VWGKAFTFCFGCLLYWKLEICVCPYFKSDDVRNGSIAVCIIDHICVNSFVKWSSCLVFHGLDILLFGNHT
jgi:hypothetical protein